MAKLLLLLSLLSLVFLFVCSIVSPENPMMWLASVSQHFQYVRLILGSILFVQLITRPPRHLLFRAITGLIAVIVGGWAIQATYSYQMEFVDTLAFLIASLAIGITSLEYRPSETEDGVGGLRAAA